MWKLLFAYKEYTGNYFSADSIVFTTQLKSLLTRTTFLQVENEMSEYMLIKQVAL